MKAKIGDGYCCKARLKMRLYLNEIDTQIEFDTEVGLAQVHPTSLLLGQKIVENYTLSSTRLYINAIYTYDLRTYVTLGEQRTAHPMSRVSVEDWRRF